MPAAGANPIRRAKTVLEAVRFEHTVFALPFAYIGMFLATDGWPSLGVVLWTTVAMAAARTLAMATNRIIHRREDAANPRTRNRPLQRGALTVRDLTVLSVVALGVFFFAAWMLNPLALALAPVAAVMVVGYAWVKYFSWTTHFVLGWADAIAPAGGWIAASGALPWQAVLLSLAVAAWVGGFDVLYTTADVEFDKRYGIHSIPRRFGIPAALWWARGMHAVTSVSLLALGLWMGLAWPYYAGWALATALLVYEHSLVRASDLSRLNVAFFNVNGYLAVLMLVATAAAVLT